MYDETTKQLSCRSCSDKAMGMLLFDDDFDGQETNTEDIDTLSSSQVDNHINSVANQAIMGKSLSDEDKRKSLKAIYDMREAQMGMLPPDDNDENGDNDSDNISDCDNNEDDDLNHCHHNDDSSRENSITTQSKFDETKTKNTPPHLTQFKSFATQLLLVDDNNTDNSNTNTMNDYKDTNPVVVVDENLENIKSSKNENIIVNCFSSDADDNNLTNNDKRNLDKVQQETDHQPEEFITSTKSTIKHDDDDSNEVATSNFISTKELILLNTNSNRTENDEVKKQEKIDLPTITNDVADLQADDIVVEDKDGHKILNEQICDDKPCINNIESKDSISKINNDNDKNVDDKILTTEDNHNKMLIDIKAVDDNEESLDVKTQLDIRINETNNTVQDISTNPFDDEDNLDDDDNNDVIMQSTNNNEDDLKKTEESELKNVSVKEVIEVVINNEDDSINQVKNVSEKDEKVNYPISLNPFGDDDDEEEDQKIVPNKPHPM